MSFKHERNNNIILFSNSFSKYRKRYLISNADTDLKKYADNRPGDTEIWTIYNNIRIDKRDVRVCECSWKINILT